VREEKTLQGEKDGKWENGCGLEESKDENG
jgi:hypothetical protein